MIPLMSKKQINIILMLDYDNHAFFGLGIHHKMFFNISNVLLGNFCSLTPR
jgi:hypothetical protein